MKIPRVIKRFASVFKDNGFQVYLVGGAIRDSQLGQRSTDYDFTTDALPEEVQSIFKGTVPVGIEHGTILVLFENKQFEVTTFRTEGTYSDSRHPDNVHFVRSLDEDLGRRDFTINAFAWDIYNEKLVDLFDGQGDLERKLIRAIGDPLERFSEDALRMMRACRFAACLNFDIETATLEAMKKLSDGIKKISSERIRDELIKMAGAEYPSIGIEYMRVSGLLEYVIPELLEGFHLQQNRFHKYDVYYHNLYSCDAAPADNYRVRLAALFHDIAKPHTRRNKKSDTDKSVTEMETVGSVSGDDKSEHSFYNHEIVGAAITYRILKRLKFKNDDIKRITHLIKHHMFYYTNEWTDGAVRRFIRKAGLENLEDLFYLREADRAGNGLKTGVPKEFIQFRERIARILEIDNAFKVTDLDIDGTTIMKSLQINPGPIIGEILGYLLELVTDDPELNNSEYLLQAADAYYQKKRDYAMEQFGKKPEDLGPF
jgi:tRNA nucleotidyltransferase (CCA-adding enzyme)